MAGQRQNGNQVGPVPIPALLGLFPLISGGRLANV